MNTSPPPNINLLPQRFRLAHQRQRERKRWRIAAAMTASIALLWGSVFSAHLMHHHRAIAQAQRDLLACEQQMSQITLRQSQRDELLMQSRMLDKLSDPIAPAAVLALLSQHFPEDAVLQSMTFQVPAPAFPDQVSAESPQSRLKTSRVANLTNAQPQAILVQLEGLVTSDVVSARLASDLSRTGLFRNVRIDDAQPRMIDNLLRHQFRVSIDIPLDGSASAFPSQKLAKR